MAEQQNHEDGPEQGFVPWRAVRSGQALGMPAWSLPTADYESRALPASVPGVIDRSWAYGGSDGSGARVCILDSGVDATHPLVAPLDEAFEVVTGEGRAPWVRPCAPVDLVGHGTACAGIVRAVAPGASITSVRVLGDGRTGSAAALVAGLEYAIDQGFDVINMSLSTGRPEFRNRLATLCDRAYFRRSTLVVAAHNLPVESFPWSFASVVSVASHAEPDATSVFYNAAPPVEFFARGVRVEVAVPGGGRACHTGNSFAAPHVAGLLARILGKHPWLTPFQLKSVLYHCASNVSSRGGGTGDGVLITRCV